MRASAQKRAVVVKILDTGVEIHFLSATKAAESMGISIAVIGNLANGRAKKSKCKCGKYANAFFNARWLQMTGNRGHKWRMKNNIVGMT